MLFSEAKGRLEGGGGAILALLMHYINNAMHSFLLILDFGFENFRK
jgi:hypothetical protein